MKNLRRLLACLIVVTMMCGLLAGCGSGGSGEEPKEEDVQEEQSKADDTSAEGSNEINDEVMELIGKKGEGVKVGIAVSDLASTYIVAAAEYAQKLLEASGAKVTLVNAEQNANTQASQIDDFISAGCNVILLHAADSDALASSVDKAAEAGVKVVGFNKEISTDRKSVV